MSDTKQPQQASDEPYPAQFTHTDSRTHLLHGIGVPLNDPLFDTPAATHTDKDGAYNPDLESDLASPSGDSIY